MAPEDRRGAWVLLVVLSAALTAGFRFLALTFGNDHFTHLISAQQLLMAGEWPTADYIDLGRPLQILASAATQRLFGETLLTEAVLVCAAFGLASAATAAVVFAATGSALAAWAAVVVETAAFPRTYGYPKPLALAVGLLLIAQYLRRPTRGRELLMAAGTAMAFLFRHDLTAFVAAGGLAAVMLADPEAPWQARLRAALRFAAVASAMAAPYLIYVQVNGGLLNYIATALQQNQREAGYLWLNPFQLGPPWEPQLLYAFHLLPVAVLAVCAVDRRHGRRDWTTRFAVCAAVVSIAANFGLIRHLLSARIPDAAVPAAVLGAWLGHRAWRSGQLTLALPSIALLAGLGAALAAYANIGEHLDRARLTRESLTDPGRVADRFAQQTALLSDRRGDPPSRTAIALDPFFRYLDRCTTERHRLFLGGFIPEVAYLARRPFAGGGFEHYNFSSPVNQERVVRRLQQQLVPFALIPSATASELDDDLPLVAAFFHGRYDLLADLPVAGEERIRIYVDRTLAPISRDPGTGWPCFV